MIKVNAYIDQCKGSLPRTYDANSGLALMRF